MSAVYLNCASVKSRDDGITVLSLNGGVTISADDAIEMIDAVSTVSDEVGPMLVIFGEGHSMTFEAQRILAAADNVSVIAVVTKTHSAVTVINYLISFFSMFKSKFKMKMFSSEDEAVAWLQEMSAEHAPQPG